MIEEWQVRWDAQGLVPAVVIDAASGEVLTLAYQNAEALRRTGETGETWFWSRSRQALWHKGETSGNTQRVISMVLDCDRDAVVIRVLPRGPACHTGARSCFAGPAGGIWLELDAVLRARQATLAAAPESSGAGERPSYALKLLGDENLRLKKLGEETAELIQALLVGDEGRCAEEAADLIFHTAVALRARGIDLSAVARVLLSRHRAA